MREYVLLRDEPSQQGVHKVGHGRTVHALCEFDRFVDHVIVCLLHEGYLVHTDPEKVLDLVFNLLFGVAGDQPVKVDFPSYHAGHDFVDQASL